jgi:lysophospholipase L1-like esterase
VLIVCALITAAEFTAREFLTKTRGEGPQQAELLFDRWAGFRTSPNYARAGVHHNAQGFRRETDVALVKPANTVRIFLMGGSAAYGAESFYPEIAGATPVGDHETITHFLEQRLNREFPGRRWEVINAAVKGFLLHEDLGRLISVVLRFHPDAAVFMDGVNDMTQLIKADGEYDPYAATPLQDQFDDLTNPHGWLGLRVMAETWLAQNSVLFRVLRDRAVRRELRQGRDERTKKAAASLSAEQRRQLDVIWNHRDYYAHVVRRIHLVLALEGIVDVFALQPTIRLTKKSLAGNERRIAEFDRIQAGPLEIEAYRTVYPEIARQLREDHDGFSFVDLTTVFDSTNVQTFTDDCHLTPEGNRIVADRLFEEIKATALPRQ